MPKGGNRFSAGRPKGTGKYNEPTKVIRVPESRLAGVKAFLMGNPQTVPLFGPHNLSQPATHLNLHELGLHNIAKPALLQLTIDIHFPPEHFQVGDRLIIDQSLTPTSADWVLHLPKNGKHDATLERRGRKTADVWGVVVGVLRQF